MSIIKNLFGKGKHEENPDVASTSKYVKGEEEESAFVDNVWDPSLEEISEHENIRYTIFDYVGKLKNGEGFDAEDIFGKGNVSVDEYIIFLEVSTRLVNLYPMYESLEELLEAESNLKGDEAGIMCKIANTYLMHRKYADAFQWYLKAAELGDSDAMCRLGGSYQHGNGVEQSIEKAVQMYKKAIITDGNADALLDLGLCYLQAHGVPRNDAHGFFLMERSAKQGNMLAQYNMGVLYKDGRGVEQNLEEALRWFHLSAAQGYELAVNFLRLYDNRNR